MKKFTWIALVLFIAASCTLSSVIGLPYFDKVDTALLGSWLDAEKPEEGVLKISKKSEKEYLLEFADEPSEYVAHTATVGKYKYMDIWIEDDEEHVFFRMDVKGDTLEYYEIDDSYKEVEFKTTTKLLNYLETYQDSVGFFKNKVTLVKKKK